MNFLLLLNISKTHLLSRFKQSAIAALGVTFGIGAFIILMSFMTGLNGMLDGLVLNRTPHIHLYNEIKPSPVQPLAKHPQYEDSYKHITSIKPKKSQTRIHNGWPIINYLRKHEAVLGAIPRVSAQAFYVAGSIELNGRVDGIEVDEEIRLFNFDQYITRGNVMDLATDNNGILLGAGAADKMSVDVGDRIQITTPNGQIIPLKIKGIFQSGLADIDNIQSYVNLKTAQRILGENEYFLTDINVKLHDLDRAPLLAKTFARQFKLTAIDIKQANAQFETGTSIRNMITYAVSITLLIVAGFGIYNILNMLIYEKINDIAILKATGFSGKDVRYIFVSQAMLIGLVGGLLGLVIGYGVSVLIDRAPFETEALPTIKTFPVNFDPQFYLIGIGFALIATFMAGYLPARRAEKIDPVEILRGQ